MNFEKNANISIVPDNDLSELAILWSHNELLIIAMMMTALDFGVFYDECFLR